VIEAIQKGWKQNLLGLLLHAIGLGWGRQMY